MQLLYIWIKDYRNIKKVGYNLGGKWLFDYDPVHQKLDIKNNPQFIDGFFRNSEDTNTNSFGRIKNISAIIGENGVGKTCFFDLIKGNLVEGSDGIKTEIIAIVENNNGEQIIYHAKTLQINNGNFKEFGFQTSILKESENTTRTTHGILKAVHYPSIPEFEDIDVIFFSNIFDGKNEFEYSGLYNISTNWLLRQDSFNEQMSSPRQYPPSDVEIHRLEEIKRQLEFIHVSPYLNRIPFPLPEDLLISVKEDLLNGDNSFFNRQFKNRESIEQFKFVPILENLIQDTRNEFKNQKDWKAKAILMFSITSYCNLFFEIVKYKWVNFFNDSDLKESLKGNENKTVRRILNSLKFIKEIAAKKFDQSINTTFLVWVQGIIEFVNGLDNVIDANSIAQENGAVFSLKTGENYEGIKTFLFIYKATLQIDNYLDFRWRDLSTGEKALLSIYARFYSRINTQVASNTRLRKNILILIDEGESFLHPNWQKQFVKLLVEFIPDIYRNNTVEQKRNIQIILASNSPIVASDIPSCNIVFLKKNTNIVVSQNSLDDKKQTFASNIHTLLADSFFMKNGFMGEFAQHKIDSIILSLQNDSIEHLRNEKENLDKIIGLIGEPIIRHKLLSLLQERLQVNLLGVDDEIKKLRARVDELEKGNNNKNS